MLRASAQKETDGYDVLLGGITREQSTDSDTIFKRMILEQKACCAYHKKSVVCKKTKQKSRPKIAPQTTPSRASPWPDQT